jgi:acetyltransferase-like isoleucine patch superfamily enzyme
MLFPGILPSFLKIRYYKWVKGYKIGKKSKISFFSYISCPKVTIGTHCRIGPFTFVEASHEIKFGNYISISMLTNIRTGTIYIDNDTEIMDHVRIGGIHTQNSKITLGKRVGIFPYAYVNPSHEIILEDGVGIGGQSHLFTHGAWMSKYDGYPVKYAPITLKKNVWLGWRVTILPGVTVGENSIIQADCLVAKDVPENSIASGNPAKIRNLYVFKYKLEQKYKIIKDIMIEFVEYMNYIGINGRYIPSDAYSKVYFKKKSGKPYFQILIWHNETSNEFQEVLKDLQRECKELIILIFSSKIVNKFKEELKNEKINYFDLEKKVLYGELYEYTVDVRIFLQRFGITFDYN